MAQSMTSARDIAILVTSTASSSERRITPSWTIAHLKTKLEPVTGIAPSSQKLTLRLPDRQQETPIEAENEDMVEIGRWPLVAYAEIKVCCHLYDYDCISRTLSCSFPIPSILSPDTQGQWLSQTKYLSLDFGMERMEIELSLLHLSCISLHSLAFPCIPYSPYSRRTLSSAWHSLHPLCVLCYSKINP